MPLLVRVRVPSFRIGTALLAFFLFATSCERPTTATAPQIGRASEDPSRVVSPGQYINFFVHAHQDDWPLFMGDQASATLPNVANEVFVYTTAGDAGQNTAYWQTRELAARAAVDTIIAAGTWTCAMQTINGHAIHRCQKGKAVSYDMRLPSCAMSGDGYFGRGCLSDLRDGLRTTLVTLDGTATYAGWPDLTATLRAIVDYESSSQGAPQVEVHSPEYDRVANTPGHPDHLATADLVLAASGSRSWNIAWYIDYNTQNMAVNLTQAQHDIKQAAFYAYDNYMGARGLGRNQYEAPYQAWLWRTYFRRTVSVPAPPPATPANLQAQPFSGSRIDLTWTTGATNGTGFYVESAPDNAGVAGTYVQIASLPISTTTYSSTGLSSATRYWFRVRAYNSSDVSPYSTPASAVTLVVPAAPTNLQATAFSTTRVDLSWTNNATNATAALVERAPDNAGVAGTYTQIASLASSAASYSDTGLGANTRYWYRVRAANATDTSAYSAAQSVLTPMGPAAPSNLVASAISATRIDLSWTNNTTSATGITVERAPDNAGVAGTYAAIATLGATAVSYSDVSALENTRYWYRVRAFNAVDVSAYSASASARTPLLPPAAPSNLQATAMSSVRIDLSWTRNSTNESGFLIERAPDVAGAPGTFVQIASVGATVVTFSNTGLTASTRYWYRVRATNATASSAYAGPASATTLAAPATRTDLYVHAHQDDWQLFMGDRAYNSVQSATKVVFVYATAGDAGQNTAFWQTRELAARAAVDTIIAAGTWTCAMQTINGHAIHRCQKGKAVSYDMRLPSCAMSGDGYFGRGCLSDLRDGLRTTLVTLDGTATYAGWSDLTATMRALIDHESGSLSAPYVEVHAPNTDRAVNVADHVDHLASADLVLASTATRSWNISWYTDYETQNLPVNLTQAQHDIKQAAFYAYDNYMGARGLGRNQFEAPYQAWLWRTYFRYQTP